MTKFSLLSQGWQLKLVGSVAIVGTFFTAVGESVLAQIVPDNTLGAEGSVVTPDVNIQGIPSDQIDGGATRSANLFHSFSEFNVGEGRGAYFANPIGIENILTRVTGGNPSNIFGRLGVLGGANLFLLNPNGIVFGANSSLDIQGSFVATTADGIQLGDSGYFSATQPQMSNLLSVSPGALFFNAVANQPTSIINQGNLSTGKNLTLSAGNLDLQGQLQAGEDLTLQAQETVKVRDRIASPFIATSGRNLTIQGNQSVDILALNHPQSKIQSGGNLSLVSDGDISGDAHFFSGGSLSMLTLSGIPGNFVSWFDPIIQANGDVLFGNYTGVALKVEATGSIQGGNIRITGAECAAGSAGCVGGIPTTDPDFDTLTGSPSVILRAGLTTLNTPNLPQSAGGTDFTATVGLTLGIRVGNIDTSDSNGGNGGDIILSATNGSITTGALNSSSSFPFPSSGNAGQGGAISLTAANGNITTGALNSSSYSHYGNAAAGGTIGLTAANGSITTGNLDSFSESIYGNAAAGGTIGLTAANGSITTGNLDSHSLSYYGNAAEGGAISLTATNDSITTGGLQSYSYSSESSGNAAEGGTITLTAANNININGYLLSRSQSYSGNAAEGGAISLTATNGSITTGSLYSYSRSTSGDGNTAKGGAITLTAANDININGNFDSSSHSYYGNGDAAEGGAINLTATNNININGDLDSSSFSVDSNAAEGGAIGLTAANDININGNLYSYSFSVDSNAAEGGAIGLTAANDININGNLYSYSLSLEGNAGQGGAISLIARNGDIVGIPIKSVRYDDVKQDWVTEFRSPVLGSFSISEQRTAGNGGNVTLEAKNNVSNLEILTLSSSLQSGTVQVIGLGDLLLTNTDILTSKQVTVQAPFVPSITLEVGREGQSGDVAVTSSGNLTFNNSSIQSDTKGSGTAGDVTISSPSLVTFTNSQIISNTSSTGQAGSITLQAPEVQFDASSSLSAQTSSSGSAGDITLQPHDGGQTLSVFFQDGAQISASTSNQGTGGNLTITAPNAITIEGQGTITTSTTGTGDAGNITLDTSTLTIARGAQLFALTEGSGDSGTITVNASTAVNLGIGVNDFSPVLSVETRDAGKAGNIIINTPTLTLSDTARITATATNTATNPEGGGSITLNASNMHLAGVVGVFAETEGQTPAGTLTLQPYQNQSTLNLTLAPQSEISASTSGSGQGGNLIVTAPEAVTIRGPGLLAVETTGEGAAGNLTIDTQRLTISDGATVSASTSSTNPNGIGGNITVTATQSFDLSNGASLLAQSNGAAPAGNITINTGNLTARDGNIATSSEQSSGGGITITADKMRLWGDSDITTNVNQGAGGGGNIYLKAGSILAFNDSDILAFSRDGRGGNITLDTPAFFGQNYRPAPRNTDPSKLENNNQVDVNATGAVSGIITLPDTTFIQNSLTELPDNQINTDRLLANSCIVRRNEPTRGTFFITGTGGLPQRPGDAQMSTFPTVDIETLPSDGTPTNTNPNRPWQKGDPIVEPQGVYRLPNGKLVLSRECP